MAFICLLGFLLIQRMIEVSISERNIKKLIPRLITPLNKNEKIQMVLLHTLWFASTLIEYSFYGKLVGPGIFLAGILLLVWCQYIRYRTMKLLGESWTTFPVAAFGQKIINNGPYRYVRHPNYLIVILEIAIVPILGQCFLTAIVLSVLNFIFLGRRIKIEEDALGNLPHYQENFSMKKKIIPFIFGLLLINISLADTIGLKSKDFSEAKKNDAYFKFSSESTKFGLITTDFEGYAKEAELKYDPKGNQLTNITLTIKSDEIDTDNSSRDKKMHEVCLEVKKYPQIVVQIESLDKTLVNQEAAAQMIVRGKSIPLKITAKKVNDRTFKGKTSFKLTDASIPDPSIAIAKVRDLFDIEFQVKLPQ